MMAHESGHAALPTVWVVDDSRLEGEKALLAIGDRAHGLLFDHGSAMLERLARGAHWGVGPAGRCSGNSAVSAASSAVQTPRSVMIPLTRRAGVTSKA